ncbi:MAG: hypothetical protein KAU50_04535, partial [Candidatus Marinimicrobia bacterium]|nr:hypothetical protein [Candidatus Neomarinimicrobiota bacterium]
MRLRRLTIPVFMLLVPAYVCLAEEGAQKITREFEVDYDGTLTLKTERGAVRVSTGRGKQLKVVVTKKLPFGWGHSEELDEFLVEFEQSGDDVTVIGKYPGQSGWDRIRRRLQVRYEIIVPKAYNLDIETSGGSIEVAAIDGNVSAETSGGSIDLGYVKG